MKILRKLGKSLYSDPSTDRKPTALAVVFEKMMARFAAYLQARTKNVPPVGLQVLLFLFCLTWGGISICLILNASNPGKHAFIRIRQIQIPKYSGKTGEENLPVHQGATKQDGSKMQSFIDSMELLKNSPNGRRIYDSILLVRPQLMDSIRRLKVLQSNKK